MLERISLFGIFGTAFSIDTKRVSRTYTTVIGGLVSIFAFILFSIITAIVVTDYRDTTKPVVSTNRVRLHFPETIYLLENGVYSHGGVHVGGDLSFNYLTIDQIKKFVAPKIEMVETLANFEGETVEKVQLVEITDVNNVKNVKIRQLSLEITEALGEEFCLDYISLYGDNLIGPDIRTEEYHITGSRFSLPYRRLRCRFYPCSLANQADCAKPTEISQLLIANSYSLKATNYSNKAKPLNLFSNADSFLHLKIGHTSVTTNFLKNNYIFDHDMAMVDERLTHSFVDGSRIESISRTRLNPTTYCTPREIEGGDCEPFIGRLRERL